MSVGVAALGKPEFRANGKNSFLGFPDKLDLEICIKVFLESLVKLQSVGILFCI